MDSNSSHRESTPTHSLPKLAETIGELAVRSEHLSMPQERALEWLTQGGSITEAAQFAGVSRQTVSTWLHNDLDFRAQYDQWREESIELAKGRMTSLTEVAMDTLAAAVRSKTDVRAAQFVLKQMGIGETK